MEMTVWEYLYLLLLFLLPKGSVSMSSGPVLDSCSLDACMLMFVLLLHLFQQSVQSTPTTARGCLAWHTTGDNIVEDRQCSSQQWWYRCWRQTILSTPLVAPLLKTDNTHQPLHISEDRDRIILLIISPDLHEHFIFYATTKSVSEAVNLWQSLPLVMTHASGRMHFL